MFHGFTPGEIFNSFAEITERAVRSTKNHPKGIGMAFIGLNLAISAGTAKRGDLIKDTTAAGAGEAAALIGGAIGAALPIPGGAIIGGILGYNIASTSAAKVIGNVMNVAKNSTHLNVGGHYTDTQQAFTMRQRAAQEMSGSLLNARSQWLGREANLFHT